MIKLDFPTFVIAFCITILAYGGRYYEIMFLVIFMGFLVIVVNSEKYPKINRFFDTIA